MNYCPSKSWEHQYLALISDILINGEDRVDRTGTGTRAVFGKHLDINLKAGFPLITTKKMAIGAIKAELLWFLEGSSDERRLAEIQYGAADTTKTTIWTDNAKADYWKPMARFDGDLGRVYGVQWRGWRTYEAQDDGVTYKTGKPIDQIAAVIDKIKNNPTDRRILFSALNIGEMSQMALPPCHLFGQFFVSKDRELSLQVYCRSQDTMLGTPFNVASYAMLVHMVAHVTGCTVGRLIMDLGDTHIYQDHLPAVPIQLARTPIAPPVLRLNPAVKNIDDFTMDDITVEGYQSYDKITLKMSV